MAKKRVKLLSEYVESAESLVVLNKDKLMASYQDAHAQVEKRQVEAELREYAGRKQELESLVENIDELIRQAKEEAKRALEAASRICEVHIVKDLPESHRQKFSEIERKRRELEKLRTKLARQRSNYEELKNGWLEEVERIIGGINEKFMGLFRQLKCCGEVELRVPDVSDGNWRFCSYW